MTSSGIEIERKYLLDGPPDAEFLARHHARSTRIVQLYLLPTANSPVRRLRRRSGADGEERTYTEKAPRGGLARDERERVIDEQAWQLLARETDPAARPIVKTRHVIDWAGRQVEIDVFDEPPGLVVAEVELPDENSPVELPPDLRVVREVSDDPAYLNVNLARR